MKNIFSNLLPRVIFERNVLNRKLPKISLRLPKRVLWLSIIICFGILSLGYYPTFSIPPVKQAYVRAETYEQKGEVIATSFSQPLVLPHPGFLSTRFSSLHPGVDIATGLTMPIHPITEGEVSEVGRDFFGLGNFVVVSHQNGFKSKYAHMGKVYVKVGQKISSENTLGEVGLTGKTSGPHTHLEITKDGDYIDPRTILPEIPNMPKV